MSVRHMMPGMLRDAFGFLFERDEWLVTVLIGGVLTLTGVVLLVPLLPLLGYHVRVLRAATADSDKPPTFQNWVTLSKQGSESLLVVIGYLILPGLLLENALTFSVGVREPLQAARVQIVNVPVFVAGVVLTLVALYLLPIALTHFAVEQRVRAAGDLSTILPAAATTEYATSLATVLAILVVVTIIAVPLSAIIVGIFVAFVGHVAVAYLLGQFYSTSVSGASPE